MWWQKCETVPTLVAFVKEVILLSLTAVNIKTSEIYRASFQDRGPEEELRAARALTGGPVSLIIIFVLRG